MNSQLPACWVEFEGPQPVVHDLVHLPWTERWNCVQFVDNNRVQGVMWLSSLEPSRAPRQLPRGTPHLTSQGTSTSEDSPSPSTLSFASVSVPAAVGSALMFIGILKVVSEDSVRSSPTVLTPLGQRAVTLASTAFRLDSTRSLTCIIATGVFQTRTKIKLAWTPGFPSCMAIPCLGDSERIAGPGVGQVESLTSSWYPAAAGPSSPSCDTLLLPFELLAVAVSSPSSSDIAPLKYGSTTGSTVCPVPRTLFQNKHSRFCAAQGVQNCAGDTKECASRKDLCGRRNFVQPKEQVTEREVLERGMVGHSTRPPPEVLDSPQPTLSLLQWT